MRGNMKQYPHPIVAERMRELWAISGLTAKEFMQKACDMDRKALYAWVNGVCSPSATSIKYICEYFDISADWLLGIRRKKK